MKLFLDTNIFVEFIGPRTQYEQVSLIIDAILEKEHTAVISTGSLYTLTYLFEQNLKQQGIHRPTQTLRLRKYLAEVLNMANMVSISHVIAGIAIYDKTFTDIEDSFQYHCALENDCDVFVTINIKDYKNADQSKMEILTPKAFVEKYL